jgi:putative membrane protein
MPSQFKTFLQRWIINTLAVLVAAHLLRGIGYETVTGLIVATLVLGLLNSFLRPIMLVLSLPLLIVTLGLFTFVINALLLMLVSWMLGPQFRVDSFWWALAGSLIISIVSVALSWVTGMRSKAQITVRRGGPPPPRRDPDDRGGPVIDV